MSRFVVLFVLAVAMLFVFQTTTSAPTEAPQSCPVNETWYDCLGGCERTCVLRNTRCLYTCQPGPNTGGCGCAEGYFRLGVNDGCISAEDCPPILRMEFSI